MRFGSLFAGVGGFDLGMEAAGWDCGWQVEWDQHCQHVLARHWPNTPRYSDVRDVYACRCRSLQPDADGGHSLQPANGTGPWSSSCSCGGLAPVDCITFGSPCQDLSVAGKRAGLDGERSGLFYEAIRIIKEMRHATEFRFPRWAIWENVAGALSSNKGNDFAAVLDTLADTGALVLEWAILDARWFGVPQRRRRVFVIACFDPATAAQCPDPLLPVAPRSSWNPPTSNTSRQDIAGTLGGGSGSRGWAPDTDGNLPPEVWREEHTAPTLNIFDNNSEARATVLAFDSTYGAQTAIHENVSPTVKVGTGLGISSPPAVLAFPLATRGRADGAHMEMGEPNVYNALRAGDGGSSRANNVLTPDKAVRRLTPLECERLMGWPDDHTRYRADGTEQSDSARYKQCGNGVASPVAAWIGHHLKQATP